MSEYLYKLNGKTFEAHNTVTNETVLIALAPYYTKPNHKLYTWLSNIAQFSEESRDLKTQKWVSSSEIKEFREKELRNADIRRPNKDRTYGGNYNTELYFYQEDARSYWKVKHRIEKAENAEKEFEKSGVTLVCFIDDIKDIGKLYEGRPIEPCDVFKLNGFLWGDEPTYGTPKQGTVDLVNGRIEYTPKS